MCKLTTVFGLAVALVLGSITAQAQPASLAGFEDQGSFLLYVNEDRVATITFHWRPDGSYEGKMTVSMAGQTVTSGLQITPDAEGRWLKILMESPLGPVNVTREGREGRRTFKDQTTTFQIRENVPVYSDLAPALMSHAIRMYDKTKGGQQKLPLFIIPGVGREVTLELKDKVERSVGGRDLAFARFHYGLPGVDTTVWVDEQGKVYLIDVPQQKAMFVREGYDALRKAPDTDPLLSKPEHEVTVDRSVGVPMRDGLKLSTDIYRPKGDGRFPVILVRTPYKKEMLELTGRFYARRGYACALQDVRGRFGSPGIWEPFMNEGRDGHDAIEWLAQQNWSTGKVGMIGGSYVGWVQWWAAAERPPHLVTIIPNVAPPDPFYNVPYEYGTFFLMGAMFWAEALETRATADLSGVTISKIFERKYDRELRPLPVIDLDKAVLGKENPYWRTWIQHPTNDAFWKPANFLDRLKDVRLPVFHQSGWFDGDGIGTKLNYLRMALHKHPNQKLILGPWGHTDTAHRMVGERDFGAQAIVDLQRAYLRWFDCWLKGIDNGITKEPLVSLFAMGSNRWLHGSAYPLPQTRWEKWYLASGGQANTSKGDGKLTRAAPPADAPPDRYTYDPGDPTPDPRAVSESQEEEKKVRSVDERKKAAETRHENVTQARQDILVYVSEPFEKPYTFVGPVSAVLYASSSAKDTDWHMRLMEVDKNGKILVLAHGKLRARYRRSMSKPELLKPGQVYEYPLDLWHTGITIPAGSRLRIEVASAAFPLFSRNLNTGGHSEMETRYVNAEQVIYHNQRYPSHVLLPAIPE